MTSGSSAESDFYCHQAIPGTTPVTVVAETEEVLAFEHTNPAYPVHVVVVPKVHVPSLVDLGDGGEKLLGKVMAVVQQVAAQMEEEHGAACVTTNVGLYQESRHLHFHVYHRGESEAQILATYSHHDS
ncbi:HIT domain-containing protein [Herbidospora solisilvae]|uniref:HIT domain-containing protein n=1 Tax=Herbidospora solisilvae TaxID=2696284 RepID=UPI001929ED3F|nr:HIT domain-containing protein [Herbidospora solisilvae]